jgi:UDP-glucose 4-epimerase
MAAIKITGKFPLEYNVGPKREGDPAMLTADANKFMKLSNWRPKIYQLEDIITSCLGVV